MDDVEDRVHAADDPKDETEYERDLTCVEGRDEKTTVEPFDPYFGRRKPQTFPWN
jgi:hypothetical protein